MLKKLKELFRYVPSDYFRINMNEFVAGEHYQADGGTFQVFRHNESKIQIIVDCNTNKVVEMHVGRGGRYY